MAQCQWPRARIKFSFWSSSVFEQKYGKNFKVLGAQLNVNPAWAITWLVGVTIYCTFFNSKSPPPRQFSRNKILLKKINYSKGQRWSRGHKARGQGQGQGHKKNPRPRPRTAFPRTDTLEAKDRNARGQGPRTQAQVLSKKKKKRSSQKFFKRSPQKNVF